MEFFFQILLEFFFEVVLQLVVEILFELGVRKLNATPWARRIVDGSLAGFAYFVFGALLGLLSLLIFPNAFVRSSSLHGISLIVTPTLAGLTMAGIGWLRAHQHSARIRLDSFAYGYIFALGMSLVRFLFTT